MDKEIRKALKNYVAENYEGNEGFCTVAETIKDFLSLKFGLGRVLSDCANYCEKAMDYRKAIEFLKASLVVETQRHIIFSEIARQYHLLGKNKKASLYFSRAIELQPNCVETLLKRSSFLLETGNCNEALIDCTDAISLQPEYADGYFIKGKIHCAMGKSDDALESLLKALDLDKFNRAIPELISEIYYVHFDNQTCALEYMEIAENTNEFPF